MTEKYFENYHPPRQHFKSMIRILFDEQGDAHHDIFFKVDVRPTFIQVADLYFVADFLGPSLKDEVTKAEIMIEFIKYIKNKILQAGEKEIFIPIDLSDQYVGGLLVTRKGTELVRVKYGITKRIYGFQINANNVDKIMSEGKLDFKIDREWIISISEIEKGLDWSSVRIHNE